VVLAATGAASMIVPVTFTVTAVPIPPAIGASPASFSFAATQGGANPSAQTLTISNTGGGTLTWSASDNAAWLTVSPASGIGNGAVTLTVTTGTLTANTYSGAITLAATGASSMTVPVTFTIATAPVPPAIGTSPTNLSFTAQQEGGNPMPQSLIISNTGGGTLTWSASDNAAWLTVSPASGTGNGTATATVTTGLLTAGTYSGTITVSATGATAVSVPVTLTVTAASTTITPSPTALTFSGVQGAANPVNQIVTITSNGTWTASSSNSWLTISPASGSGNGTVTASVNLATAVVGTNSATITVIGGGTTRTVTVTLTVSAPSLTVNPTNLSYTGTQGAANPASQSVTVSSNQAWAASDNASWLTVNPTSGSNNGTITASVNTATAVLGPNNATITVTGGGITRTVTVTLTLNAPSTSSATLTWIPNTEPDLASYRIYQSNTQGVSGPVIATVLPGTTSYTATGLQVGQTYYFKITAVDTASNESEPSNEVSKSIF